MTAKRTNETDAINGTGAALIELDNVSRSFETQSVLNGISLSVDEGRTLALIGESGCGKSVTMKLMAGLLEPSSGTVRWNGKPVDSLSRREQIQQRLRFGYLFQAAALFDSLTVYENVAFGLRENTTLAEDRIRQVVQARLKEVGLPDSVCAKKPAELSGGMKKRVGLARALALSPEIMLYDEPTTGLDPIMSDVINELILQTQSQRPVTSVVVTHDMKTVQKVADRVVMLYPVALLEPGEQQVVFDGTVEQAFSSKDPRVARFVNGEAADRIRELSVA